MYVELSVSLDGYVAGASPSLEHPLGLGGEQLHEWAFEPAAFREAHGMSGGEHNADSERFAEAIAGIGAVVMGRRMFSGGAGPWEDDPNADAWWGDDPPFHVPVFVVTHHARETVEKDGGTTFVFVTDGIALAVEQARAAAGNGNVQISGGANVAQQALAAGLVDELQLHLVPVLLGGGTRLLEHLSEENVKLELDRVVDSPGVTHLWYRVR